jgi:hypothetical protein
MNADGHRFFLTEDRKGREAIRYSLCALCDLGVESNEATPVDTEN